MFVLRIRAGFSVGVVILIGLITRSFGGTGTITPAATGVDLGFEVAYSFSGNTDQPYCLFDWGDETSESAQLDDDASPTATKHTYPNATTYDLHIICVTFTDIFTVDNTSVYVGNFITGFDVANFTSDIIVGIPGPLTGDIILGIQYSTGTHTDILVTVMSDGYSVSASDYNAPDTEFVTLDNSHFPNNSMYAIEVNASNPISTLSRHMILAIETPITDVSLSSPDQVGTSYFFLVDHNHTITTTLTGENPVFTWWLTGDTLVDSSVEVCDGPKTSNTFTIQHNTTGIYTLTQEIGNHVNVVKTDLNVSFFHPVNDFSMSLNSNLTLYNEDVIFTLDLASTAGLQMGTVVCDIVFEDGSANQTLTFDLTTDDYVSLSALNKQQLTAGKQYVAGWYYPYIKCSNELPDTIDGDPTFQEFSTFIISVNPVVNISLSHNSPNTSNHPFTKELKINLSLGSSDLPLANLTCTFTYSDTKSPINKSVDLSDGNPLTTIIPFTTADKQFSIEWNCSNELSHQTDTLEVYVYYDCWTKGTYFDDAVHNPATGRTAYTHIPYTVQGDVQVQIPYVCDLPIVSYLWAHRYISNSNEIFFNNYTIADKSFFSAYTFKANTMEPGLYKIYLSTAFPSQPGHPMLVDYLFVEFVLPDLKISVLDGEGADNNKRNVKKDKSVTLDSRDSVDPSADLPSVTPTSRAWTCVHGTLLTEEAIDTYFFSGELPATEDCSELFLNNGGQTDLAHYNIHGDQFTPEQWYLFKLTFSSGTRTTMKSIAVRTTEYDSIIGYQQCNKGCKPTGDDVYKLIGGDLNMDLVIPEKVEGLDISSVTYLWTFQSVDNTTWEFQDQSLAIVNRRISGLQVNESSIKQLTDMEYILFQLKCTMTANNFANTTISRQFVYNLPPYNGNCQLLFESGTVVGSTSVTAALQKVCVECTYWKDEGKRRDRGPDDDGGSLFYEIRQIFLKDDNTTDTSLSPVILAANRNMRNCMLLSATDTTVNSVALIETKIKDSFSKPYAINRNYVDVVPPITPDASGADGQQLVEDFTALLNDFLGAAIDTGNSAAVVTTVVAGTTSLQIEGLEGDTVFNVLGEDLVDFLIQGEPELDATLIAIQEANANLTATLTLVEVNDVSTGMQIVGAVAVISSGPEVNMNISSKDNLVTSFASVSHTINNTDLSDPTNIDYINNIVAAGGALSTLLVARTLMNTEIVSRTVQNAEQQFETTNIEENTETDDETNFYALRKQTYNNLDRESVKNMSNELDKISTELQYSVLESTQSAISIGVQMVYKGDENSDGIAVKKDKASEFASRPIVINNVAVYLSFDNVGEEQNVTVALSESSNVLKLDDSNRAADGKGQFKFITKTEAQISSFTTIIQLEPVSMTTVYPVIDPEDASRFSYHLVLVKSKDDMLCIATQPSSEEIAYYKIWINKPSENGVTKVNFVASEVANEDTGYSACFSTIRRGSDIGNWRIGVEGITRVTPIRKRREATNETYSLYPAYNFGVVTTACMVWDDSTESWTSSTCDGKWNITSNTLECRCPPQREMTFTNSFYVAPNKIDFSSVFLRFSPLNQAAVMGTLAGVLTIYILVVIWARRNDRKDLLKWGITPLLDNFVEDNYFYIIRVYTGMRPNSGTKSRIGMVIAGDEMDTGVRELYDGVRKEFATGSVMNFLLSTNMFLGELEYLRLWHDNSGGGNFASWYLSKIEVQDVQRNETFSFLSERWLSVEEEDGSLECVLPLAKSDNLNVFKNRFFINAKTSLAESHIWISVVYRPQTSNFTRVQRASCALVFVMLTMISNAMFFKSTDEPNYSTPAEVQVGPFRFSLQQVYISMQCALMTTSATLVVIYLFKLSRNKPPKESVLFKPKEQGSQKKYRIPYIDDWLDREHEKSVKLERNLVEKGYPKYEGFFLPYWCRYLAWLVVVLSFVVCGFFLMLYSMEWGKQKSEEWLTNFFLTFFESVFALDPVKVAIMALVFAILFRATSESSIIANRQTIMRNYAGSQRGKSGGIRLPAPPLDHKRLEEERVIRTRELKMKRVFRDVVVQVFQIWILLSISFSNRDNRSYAMYQETDETLLDPLNLPSFTGIQTVEQYYDWLNNTAIINLFPEDDYNGDRLHWRLRQFSKDGAKFRVGPPRLRQVRVPKDICDIPHMETVNCYGKYASRTEDTDDQCIGWQAPPCDPKDEVYKFSSEAWRFTSALDIWGLPLAGVYTTYGGGGYIAKLSVNREVSQLIIAELYDNSWVDRQTRAVIFEFTLYCLNANIFTYNMFMVEFPETGGAFPFSFILPLRVYQHTGALGKYTLACEVIFLLYLAVMTIMAGIGIYKERKAYFSQPWQVYDLVFILAGYVAIAMYSARIIMTHYALKVFREDKKEFVNFYHVAMWDQILVLLIGILVFLAIFRLLNILGYNKRIGAVARVFTNAAGDLLWFGLFFVMIFTCYAAFGYLLFGSQLTTYRNLYRTMGTLFISMIGKSKFTEIEETDPIMSKLYFMVFIFFVVYMILTMFLGILSHSISKVRQETENDKGDEMVDYMVRKFKGFLGYGGGGGGPGDRRARNLSMYTAQPPAPWNMKKSRKFEYDNRQILEDIRMSLTEAMNMDPKEFSTPEPFQKTSKKPRH